MIKRYIISTSKGLVEIRKSYKETVQFIHESVNDFLLRNKRLQTLDPMLEPHAIGFSHDRLAACCMSYIMMEDIKPSAEDISSVERENFRDLLASNYPFLEYAASYVLFHADRALSGGVKQDTLLERLEEQHRELKRLQNFLDIFQDSFFLRITGAGLIYTVLTKGYFELLQVALIKGADVNAQGGYFGNALQVASYKGNEAVVALLLENVADANVQGGKYGNALQAASYAGNGAIVALLLKNGANVSAQGGFYSNALQAASRRGNEATVALLLENGAEVNAQGGEYGNALQAASYAGNKAIVALLLENGADVNAKGGCYGNALQAALDRGDQAVVHLLLEAGAKPFPKTESAAQTSGIETSTRRKKKRRVNGN